MRHIKYITVVILICLAGCASATSDSRTLGGVPAPEKPVRRGLYVFQNYGHIDGEYVTGSQVEYNWNQLNPSPGVYDWSKVDAWSKIERERGHAWVLRVDLYQNRGAYGVPAWSAAPVSLKDNAGRLIYVPDYASARLQADLATFVKALGAKYDRDPTLALVQIGLGLYGEAHPERNDTEGALASALYDQKRLNGCQWIQFAKTTIDAYVAAFPSTAKVIMSAPTYPFGCRETQPPYATTYPRKVIQDYAKSKGVGMQNNSLGEWDANWYTCEVQGSNGPYIVDGSVDWGLGAGLPVAFERGSWLAPFGKSFGPTGEQTWWSYLNALSKNADIIFPPQYKTVVGITPDAWDIPSGVFSYPAGAPYATDLQWMHGFVRESMAGKLRWWVAFDAPPGDYWGCTAQHTDHELGIHRATAMQAEWAPASAKAPFFEDKYMRRLAGSADFTTTPGRYVVTLWHRGTLAAFGHTYSAATWARQTIITDVPARFTISGTGHLHAIILSPVEEATVTPAPTQTITPAPTETDTPEPPPSATPTQTAQPTATPQVAVLYVGKQRITIIIEEPAP